MIPPSLIVEQSDETRLSRDRFDALMQKHLTDISEAQYRLQLACAPFRGKGNVQPIQCREAIDSLSEIKKRMQEFGVLLNETSYLPIIYTTLRYRLLFVLRLIEEQAWKLINLIDSYCIICMTSSPLVRQQSKTISESTEMLSQHITSISQQVKFINDEAMFQEQNLASQLEEKLSSEFTGRASFRR